MKRLIGLTGQSGAGKTQVAMILEKCGFYCINADEVSHCVTSKNKECIKKITDIFPECCDKTTGNINRRRLGDIVFKDREKLKALTDITFPHIIKEIFRRAELFRGELPVVIDAPTLFESGLYKSCDKIISVIADPEIRKKRIICRDGITEAQAETRMDSQLSESFFRERSDYIIENNGDFCELEEQVLRITKRLKNKD